MPLPLEDQFNDVINKALRGLKLTPAQVAERAGLETEAVQSLSDGEWSDADARKVAPLLGLDRAALAGLAEKTYEPAAVSVSGLAQFNTPFEDMTVNSYLVWDEASREAAAFDTGSDCTEMLELLTTRKLRLAWIFLTHTHGDHIFDLDRLKEKTGASALVGAGEPLEGAKSFAPGATYAIGSLHVDTRLTWGHSKGGITYVVSGLGRPVAIVGDAVFAGSMGGGAVSYGAALDTNRKEIFSLTDDTVICPGHGPMTSVGEEKVHNPFFSAGV